MSISQLVPSKEAEIALLEELQNEGKPLKTGELVKRAIGHFPMRLTASELQRKTPSGTLWWLGRFRYNINRLKKRGEVQSPAKGYWEITKSGIDRLANPKLSEGKKKYLNWMEEVIKAIKAGEVTATIRTKKDGFTVELGKHIQETQIVLGRKTPEIKLVIDGEEVILQRNGKSRTGTYEKWKEPEPYAGLGPGETPLIVTVYRKPGWKPSDEVT